MTLKLNRPARYLAILMLALIHNKTVYGQTTVIDLFRSASGVGGRIQVHIQYHQSDGQPFNATGPYRVDLQFMGQKLQNLGCSPDTPDPVLRISSWALGSLTDHFILSSPQIGTEWASFKCDFLAGSNPADLQVTHTSIYVVKMAHPNVINYIRAVSQSGGGEGQLGQKQTNTDIGGQTLGPILTGHQITQTARDLKFEYENTISLRNDSVQSVYRVTGTLGTVNLQLKTDKEGGAGLLFIDHDGRTVPASTKYTVKGGATLHVKQTPASIGIIGERTENLTIDVDIP